MGAEGDILLYGCYVAADGSGGAFLDALAEATGADVAASDDLTGADAQGGDWTLESATGAVFDGQVDDLMAQSGFQGVLALSPGTITFGTNGSDILIAPQSSNPSASNVAGSGLDVQVVMTSGDARIVLARDPSISDNSTDLVLQPDSAATDFGVIDYISFTADDGGDFQLDSFEFAYNAAADSTFNVQAFSNGSQVGSNVAVSVARETATTVNLGADFENIDEFRVVVGFAAKTNFDNFVIAAAVAPNTAPVFTSAPNGSIGENVANGTNVVNVDANDGDGGGTDAGITYSITGGNTDADGDGNLPFAIDAATGQITVNDTGDIDFESGTTAYALTVQADDGGASNNTTTANLTVSITNDGTGATARLEGVSDGQTSFTSSSQTFGVTGTFTLQSETGFGSNLAGETGRSDGYADTGIGVSRSGDVGGVSAPAGYTFRALGFDVWPSGDAGTSPLAAPQSITVVGYNGGVEALRATVSSFAYGQSPAAFGGAWQRIDLTGTAFRTTSIDAVRFELTGGQNYLALDNFTYDNLAVSNDPPALGGTPPDATVTEDVAGAIDLSAYNVSDADGDTLTLTLAVDRGTIASVDGDGVTAGVTVANSGTAAMTLQGTAASLNTYLNDSSKIRYTTALNDTTAATLTVTPNDGTVDGTPDTVTISVTPVNDAPVLNAGASPALTGIVEDAGDDDGSGADGDDDATNNANNPGTSVAAMVVDGSITDPDGGAVEAIAVTAVDNTNGVWQYSTDNGANWTAFSGTSGSSVDLSSAARLLDGTLADAATNLIRFVPDADYNGTATITFRAWDRSSGSAGGTADTTTNGGATAFSAASDTASIGVSAVNDAPVFAGLDGAPSFTEDGSAVQLDADVTVSDVELGALNGGNGDFAGASLTIARNGGANADDSFGFDTSGASFTVSGGNLQSGGLTFATFTNTGGTLTVNFTSSGTTATTALVAAVLQRIAYQNTGDDPPASVQLDWSFGDGNSGDAQGTGANPGTGTGSTTVSITGVNDEPTLTATRQDPTYVEGAAAADLYSTVAASTVESGQTFTSLTLTVTNVSDGANEILRVDGSDVALTDGNSVTTATNGLTVNVSVAGSTATVSFTGASLSAAALQTLVDALAYRNASDNPTTAGNRVVTITQVTDSGASGGANDNTAALTLASTVSLTAVNNPPVVGSVFGETSQVTAGSGAQNVSGFDDATVSNPDSADYDGGVLTLVQGSGTTNGSWGLDGTTATAGGDGSIAAGETIAVGGTSIGTVDATNDGQGGNTLEIALNADATSARIQSLIRALTYSAPSGLGDRGFTLTLNDADGTSDGGDQDASGSFTVSVTPNPPVVANLDGDSVSTPNGTAVSIDQGGNATVSDPDSANFNGGNLTITRTSGSGDFSLNAAAATSGGDGTIAAGQTVAVGGTDIGTVTTDGQGTNDLVITFNSADATPARVQALIRALQFSSTDGGSNTFSLTVTDAGSSAATSTAAGFTVDVEAAPVNSVPGAQTATDGTALALGGISVADADSANVTTTVSVGAGQGTFTTSGAATIAGGGTNSIQISGTLAAVNATLANLAYTPAVDSSGNQTITVLTSDGTNSDTDTIAVTVSDRPNLGNLAGDSQTATPGSTANLDAGANATVTDTDSADFDGGNLTLSRVSGSLSGNFSLDGTTATSDGDGTIAAGETIAVGGTSIGTVTSDGQGTNNLVIALNADATPARVATLLQNLRYTTSAAGTHGFDVTLTDAAGGTTSEAARAELVFNSAPAITTNTGLSHTAGTATVLTTAMLAASDAEGDAVTYTLTSAPGTGSLRLDGSALAAGQSFTAAQLAAGQVSFLAPADTPAGSTSFQVTPGDGTSSGAAASVAVAIAAAPAAETGTAETGTADTGTGDTGTGGTGDTGEADDDGDAVTVVVERRGPVQLVLVQTPAGNLQFATAPTQVSGAAVQAIFSTFEQGNSPLARAFYSSLLGGSATPVAQAFASAVSDPAVRGLLSAAANEGRALYYFDGSDWQLLDLSTLDDAGAIQQAGGAPGTNPDASQSAAATAATATAATATAATATAATAGLPDGIQLAAQLGDQLGDQLGNTQLGAQPGDTQPGAQPGDPQPGDPQPGDPLAPRAAAPAGAESFQRQLAAAALGFEREAARLAAALLATKT